jgi:hypothetical protein
VCLEKKMSKAQHQLVHVYINQSFSLSPPAPPPPPPPPPPPLSLSCAHTLSFQVGKKLPCTAPLNFTPTKVILIIVKSILMIPITVRSGHINDENID